MQPKTHISRSAMLAAAMATVSMMTACGGGSEEEAEAMESAMAVTPTSTDGTWVKIANEGQAFSVGSGTYVRYGSGTKWVGNTFGGTAQCSNGTFGRDPIYGTVKQCDKFVPSTTAVPAPAPAPAPTTSVPACTQTLSAGANVASAVSNAAAGAVICLNSGSYGSVNLAGISKASDVTLRSTTDKTASMSLSISNSNRIRVQNLTLSSLNMWNNTNRNISILGNKFTGQFLLQGSGSSATPANILVDGNSFDGITAGPDQYEGRLQISNGGGVTVSNNHFGGGGDSDGIQMGGYGGTIGPGNVFEDLVYNGARHVDAIQLYGGVKNYLIKGNYFQRNSVAIMAPDGGDSVTITNNVFIGNNINSGEIQLGSQSNTVFTHNVVYGMAVGLDKKSESPTPSSNALVKDNIFVTRSRLAANCTNCTFTHNQFDGTSTAYGSGNIMGSPIFVGGSSSWSAYKLSPGSVGYGAATDKLNMGVN